MINSKPIKSNVDWGEPLIHSGRDLHVRANGESTEAPPRCSANGSNAVGPDLPRFQTLLALGVHGVHPCQPLKIFSCVMHCLE